MRTLEFLARLCSILSGALLTGITLMTCYSLIGRWSLLRVSASRRDSCNNCMDCFAVCPEPQVLRLPLKGALKGFGPVVMSPNCTNCGRCIDICSKDVFSLGSRFNNSVSMAGLSATAPK